MSEEKAKLYSTAKATIGCALFAAGDFVSVEFYCLVDGTCWFLCSASKGGQSVAYPEHHLTQFVL